MNKPPGTYPEDLENIEVDLLLEAVFKQYGYDFKDYARESLRRRIWKSINKENLTTISGFMDRVLHDEACMKRFLTVMSIDVSSMFRDPFFFFSFRQKVVPMLKERHHIKIWHAGCATGEEVYSMAILLKEEGLLARTRIYATDMNEIVLEKARAGIYSQSLMKDYTANYIKAGGTSSFSDYYTAKYDNAVLKPVLKANIVWAQHNLVTDQSFNEFDCILCRNVMIYFNRKLKDKVLKLFCDSLAENGVLALGKSETLDYTEVRSNFEKIDDDEKIYLKKRR